MGRHDMVGGTCTLVLRERRTFHEEPCSLALCAGSFEPDGTLGNVLCFDCAVMFPETCSNDASVSFSKSSIVHPRGSTTVVPFVALH